MEAAEGGNGMLAGSEEAGPLGGTVPACEEGGS